MKKNSEEKQKVRRGAEVWLVGNGVELKIGDFSIVKDEPGPQP